jgi:hypothetical protein
MHKACGIQEKASAVKHHLRESMRYAALTHPTKCPERVGKSPTELRIGQKHPHWPELLGYQRFVRK